MATQAYPTDQPVGQQMAKPLDQDAHVAPTSLKRASEAQPASRKGR